MTALVARLLGFVTSADSLLRLQRFPAIFPRVLGVRVDSGRGAESYAKVAIGALATGIRR